jgi:hypothetical protein
MTITAIWQSRPLFITSTFKDLHAERNYLHNVVLPEREKLIKARFQKAHQNGLGAISCRLYHQRA